MRGLNVTGDDNLYVTSHMARNWVRKLEGLSHGEVISFLTSIAVGSVQAHQSPG